MDGRWITAAALVALGGAKALSSSGSRALAPGSKVAEMGEQLRRRFPRWSDDAWEQVVRGAGARLARALDRSGASKEDATETLSSWLGLVGELMGQDLVSPSDRPDLFTAIWLDRVPTELPSIPAGKRYLLMANLFNACEAAAKKGAWFRSLLDSDVDRSTPLADLAARLSDLEGSYPGRAFSPDAAELHWVGFGASFLPGDLEVVHGFDGRLVVVTDRLSRRAEGLWLSRDRGPIRIGALPPGRRALRAVRAEGLSTWDELSTREPSLTRRYHAVETPWWSVASLVTSRYVVCAVSEGIVRVPAKGQAATAGVLDLGRIVNEIGEDPLYRPRSDAFSAATLNDLCRRSGTVDPLTDAMWADLGLSFPKRGAKLLEASSPAAERLSVLSFFCDASSLGDQTLSRLRDVGQRGFLLDRMSRFLDSVATVDLERTVSGSGKAREEFLRKWALLLGVGIEGQTQGQSQNNLRIYDSTEKARRSVGRDAGRSDRIRTTLRQTWAAEKELGPWRQE